MVVGHKPAQRQDVLPILEGLSERSSPQKIESAHLHWAPHLQSRTLSVKKVHQTRGKFCALEREKTCLKEAKTLCS